MATDVPQTQSLRDRVAAEHWYHVIDLGNGLVTPGWFDTRALAPRVPMPASLAGKRCLDVGTWDGFWAFEMERRGASEVVAIDIDDPRTWDWPPARWIGDPEMIGAQILGQFKREAAGFKLAKEALGSRVERVARSIYDLDPAIDGTFDFVFLGSLLLHLRDPVRALDSLRSVCGGEAVICETVEAIPSLLYRRTAMVRLDVDQNRPWWWQPNVAAFRRMVQAAGFQIVEQTGLMMLPLGPGHPRTGWGELLKGLRRPEGRERLIQHRLGLPHTAVRARPMQPA